MRNVTAMRLQSLIHGITTLCCFLASQLCFSVAPQLCLILAPQQCFSGEVDFNRDVRPILADNCYECHGPDEESRAADLRLDLLEEVIGWVIDPRSPHTSTLMERLLSEDPEEVMPPLESKRRPTAAQVETLREWIAQGAEYQEHWAFVTPKRPTVPTVEDTSWPRNPIDNFVAAHLESRSLVPQEDVSPRLLARRLSLVLTGLPVTPQRADRFAADYAAQPDTAIDAFVDELLASHAYGEHWAWMWLDAARYADTNGYQADGERVMWPWRDWLIRGLNANLPFDEMTRRMLAGDLMMPEQHREWQSADWIADDRANELLIATGFLRNHRYDTGSGTIPAESKFENAADRLETVGTVWMGMTLLCARCHTHKYDPIENREYYELLSFFDNVPEIGSALKGASHPYIHTPTEQQRVELKRLLAQAEKADAKMAAAEDQLATAQAEWERTLNDQGVREAEHKRVTRGLKYQYAQQTLVCEGKTSLEKPNDAVKMCAGNRRWTISFWFRPQTKDDCAIFASVDEPERDRQGIQADWVHGKVRLRHVCRWVNSYIEFKSKDQLKPGRWYHVTFRCDGRMQGIGYSASLNGSDDAMICTHPVTNDSAGNAGQGPLFLGGNPLMPNFVGSLRDLRFYDRVLSPAEVESLADVRSTHDIAGIPQESRTAHESELLRLAFLESDALPPELRDLREARLTAHARLAAAIRETPTTMVMRDTVTEQTRVRRAGVFDSLGDEVADETPKFLPPLPEGKPDRLALADWLVHPEHPLTARVAVNRIWQALWGRGFVDSPENFGTQCAEPLHADLLDWLATEYVRSGWDTKALIKLIVTSRGYRQSSQASEAVWKSDPRNRHLARGPRFRLPVHVVRDQALSLSGRLDATIGGPPVVLDVVIGKDGKPVKVPYATSNRRRTLYTFWKRNSPHPLLAVFDVADRNQCEVRTMRTNTPLQALVTLNEPGFAAAAEGLGARARGISADQAEQLRWVWQACTGRQPDEYEMETLRAMLEKYTVIAKGDEADAWTALCNVLLNLDAVLTLE